jgi:hypothetical protein
MSMSMITAKALLISCVVPLLSGTASQAQEPPHKWIQDSGLNCCSPEHHCFPIGPDQVKRSPAGAVVRYTDKDGHPQTILIAPDKIMESLDPDGRTWLCTWQRGCLFVVPEA